MADIVQITLHQHCNGRDLQNVLYYQAVSGSPSFGSATDAIFAWNPAVLNVWKAAMSNEWRPDMIVGRLMDDLSGPLDQVSLFGTVGEIAGDALPDNAVLRVTKQATVDGVGAKRGGLNLSGIPESATDGNRITDAYQSGVLQDLLNALAAQFGPDGNGTTWAPAIPWGTYARAQNGTVLITAAPSNDTTLSYQEESGASVDWAARGFQVGMPVSVNAGPRRRGSFMVQGIDGIEMTVDAYLEPALGIPGDVIQKTATAYEMLDSVSASPVLKTLKRRQTRYEGAV